MCHILQHISGTTAIVNVPQSVQNHIGNCPFFLCISLYNVFSVSIDFVYVSSCVILHAIQCGP